MLDPAPFIRLQCIPMFFFGLFLYFGPEHVLPFVLNASLDGVHFHMARCTASFCIVLPFMYWYWSKSADNVCNTTSLKSMILFNGFSLVATWYARVFAADFVHGKIMLCIMLFNLALLLFDVYLLLKSGWPTGRIEYEPDRAFTLNRMFMFDTYSAMLIGCLWMAYPDLLLRRQIRFPLTQHHAFVCRVFGSILAASSAYGFDCVSFKSSRDRRCGLITRFFANVLVLLSQLHSQYAYHQWWTHGHWVGMTLWTIWMILVVFCLVKQSGKWK